MPTIFNTWEGDPNNSVTPYRPGVSDFGGADLQDDLSNPPDPSSMPTAAGWNQKVRQATSVARVVSSARVDVTFPSGTPTVIASSAASQNVQTTTFVPTDNGAGDTTLTVPATALPPRTMAPRGFTLTHIAGSPAGVRWADVEVVSSVAVRVRTYEGTTLKDLPFSLDWD